VCVILSFVYRVVCGVFAYTCETGFTTAALRPSPALTILCAPTIRYVSAGGMQRVEALYP
jgi:hypothetical protein